jgi:surfactin synthase thioesterase subunit
LSVLDAQGWRAHTSAEFELRTFEGGHFYLSEGPVAGLAAAIAESVAAFGALTRVAPGRLKPG